MNKLILFLAFFTPTITFAQEQGILIPPDTHTLILPWYQSTSYGVRQTQILSKSEVTSVIRTTKDMTGCTFDQIGQIINGKIRPGYGYTDFFETNARNVGVRIGVTKGWDGAIVWGPFSHKNMPIKSLSSPHKLRAELSPLQRLLYPRVLEDTPYLEVTYSSSCFPTVVQRVYIASARGEDAPPTCTATQKSLNVTLDRVKLSDLKIAASTAGAKNFSLAVNCPSDAILYMTFTDKNNTGNRGNYLSLDKSSTASGVGIEILHNGNPLTFREENLAPGSPYQIKLTGATKSVPLTARYRSLGNTKGGTVSAASVITFNYN